MNINYKKALNEVSQIINLMSEDDQKRISTSFLKFVEKNKSKFNEIDIVPNKNLDVQNISEEAKAFIYLMVKNFSFQMSLIMLLE